MGDWVAKRDRLRTWAITHAPAGAAVEFGVGSGESLRLFAQHRFVHGFDSFKGLPEDWRPGYPKGTFACDPPDVPNTELIVGDFSSTVPDFIARGVPVAFAHIDCDLYSSTVQALKIAPLLVPDAVLLFDEYQGYPGCESQEQRALDESGISYDMLESFCEQVAVRVRC